MTLRISRRDFVKIAGTALVLSSIPVSISVVSGIRQPSVSRLEAIGSREVVRTFCGMCGALCGIQVVKVDGRIAYVEPLDGHPQRGLCGRSASTVWLWDSPPRLRKPLKRVGERGEARFQEVDWDTALNEIAAKLSDNALCVKACPTKASYYDPKTGLVTIDYRLCVGCKACVVACPYGASGWTRRATCLVSALGLSV